MLTVEEYVKIRTAKRDGMSIRAICRTHHHSHHTVGKVLNNPQPRPYTRTKPTVAPVLGPFTHIIDQILLDDQAQPTKQRHKASKIYRRLRDEYDYKGAGLPSMFGFTVFSSIRQAALSQVACVQGVLLACGQLDAIIHIESRFFGEKSARE
jgi:hypothetical protein